MKFNIAQFVKWLLSPGPIRFDEVVWWWVFKFWRVWREMPGKNRQALSTDNK